MYRDVIQWQKIRRIILKDGLSQRQVARDTGIDTRTIRKMLAHSLPQRIGPRSHRYPTLGPFTASIQRLLQDNSTRPTAARLSKRAIFEYLRDKEGFQGGYSTVKDYIAVQRIDDGCISKFIYDALISLEEQRAIDLILLLSRADPPVISSARAKAVYRAASQAIKNFPDVNKGTGRP